MYSRDNDRGDGENGVRIKGRVKMCVCQYTVNLGIRTTASYNGRSEISAPTVLFPLSMIETPESPVHVICGVDTLGAASTINPTRLPRHVERF